MRFQLFFLSFVMVCAIIPMMAEAQDSRSGGNPLLQLQNLDAKKSYGMQTVTVTADPVPQSASTEPKLHDNAKALADQAASFQQAPEPNHLHDVQAAFEKEKPPVPPAEDKTIVQSESPKTETVPVTVAPKLPSAASVAAEKEIIFSATKPDGLQKPPRLINVR